MWPPSSSDAVHMTYIALPFFLRCCIYDIYCTLHPTQMCIYDIYCTLLLPQKLASNCSYLPILSSSPPKQREATNWKGDKKENRNLSRTLPVAVYVICLLSSQTLRTNCTFNHNAFGVIWKLGNNTFQKGASLMQSAIKITEIYALHATSHAVWINCAKARQIPSSSLRETHR